jgi:hypothetical protein
MKVQTLPKMCFARVTTLDITAQGCQYVRSTRTSGAETIRYPRTKLLNKLEPLPCCLFAVLGFDALAVALL